MIAYSSKVKTICGLNMIEWKSLFKEIVSYMHLMFWGGLITFNSLRASDSYMVNIGKPTIIGSDNGLSAEQRQTII